MQSYLQMPRRRSVVSFRACLGGTTTKPLTLMSLMRPALNSSGTMSPAVLPLLSAPFSTKLDYRLLHECGCLVPYLVAWMMTVESLSAGVSSKLLQS